MAAGIIHEPGSEYGPCTGDCAHRDCAESRSIAEAECVRCDQPIGYGVRFYAHDSGSPYRPGVPYVERFDLEHSACAERGVL